MGFNLFFYSAYQIGVHCKDVESEPTFFDGENSTDCSYIAGEVPNMEEEQEFIVGDGKKYGNYENKLLKKDMEYDIYVSIVTRTSEVRQGVFVCPTPLPHPTLWYVSALFIEHISFDLFRKINLYCGKDFVIK